MANKKRCVNTKHPEFKELLEQTGMNEFELEAAVHIWQDTLDVDTFPKKDDLIGVQSDAEYVPDNEVDRQITDILNRSGINIRAQKVYAEGYSTRNGRPLTVAARADLTRNLIEYDSSKASELTLAEEAGHFVIAANEGKFDYNRAMRLVETTQEYAELNPIYSGLYASEARSKMEVLGKMFSKHLNEQIKSPLLKYFKRMLNRVKAMLGSRKAQLDLILDKFAKEFVDQGVDPTSLTGEFFDLGDTTDTYIKQAIGIHDKILKGLKSKLTLEQRQGYKPYKLEEQYYDILDAEHTVGILKFLSYMNEDTVTMMKYISNVNEGRAVFTTVDAQQMHQALSFYRQSALTMKYFLENEFKNNPDYSNKQRKALLKQTNDVIARLARAEAFHRVKVKVLAKTFAKDVARQSIQDDALLAKELEAIDKAVSEVDYDMNQMMYWFGSLAHTTDNLVKSLHSTMVNANQKVNQFTYNLAKRLMAKAEELGISDTRSLMETQDGKFTGYFKNRLKHGAWNEAFKQAKAEIDSKFGLGQSRELDNQIKHEWRLASNKLDSLTAEHGKSKAMKLMDADELSQAAQFNEYSALWSQWFARNTQPLKDREEVIARKRAELSKEDFDYWYRKNTGTTKSGALYYKNELIEPSDGSKSHSRVGGSYVTTVDWTNPDFNTMTANELEMRNFMMEVMEEADSKHTKSRNRYKLPQIRASFVNLVKNQKFGNIKEQIAEEFKITEDDTDFGEMLTYPDGTVAKFVPMYFVADLTNPDNISTDLLNSVMLYGKMAEDFKTKASLEATYNTVLEALGNRTVKGDLGVKSEAYKAVEKFIDMNIYGIRKERIKLFGVDVTKMLGTLKKYVTANNLVFNLFTTVAGYATGSVYSKIEDLVGQYSNQTAKTKAEKTFDTNVHKMMLEFGKPNKTSKLGLFLEEHGVIKDADSLFKNLDLSRLSRAAINSGLYFQYELVRIRLRGKLALAFAHDLKYDPNEQKFFTTKQLDQRGIDHSEFKDYWQMHVVENNRLKPIHKDTDVLTRLSNKVDYIGNNLEGELDQTDYAAAHQHAILQLVTTHRGWLFRTVQLRFKGRGVNYITGQEELGYYTGFFDFMKSTFFSPERVSSLKALIDRWGELSPVERQAVQRTMYEMAFMNAIASIAFILNGLADDDKDSWLKQYLAYQSTRILLEVSAINPFPAVALGPDGVKFRPPFVSAANELVEVLNSPIAATRQLQDLQDLMYIFSDEEIDRGPYEGMTKGERAIKKLIVGSKGIHQVRSAEAIRYQNQFVKSKALKWMN